MEHTVCTRRGTVFRFKTLLIASSTSFGPHLLPPEHLSLFGTTDHLPLQANNLHVSFLLRVPPKNTYSTIEHIWDLPLLLCLEKRGSEMR